MNSRRFFLAVASAVLLPAVFASASYAQERPPIVFVHGNGDNASIWQTTIWRFESNGWPRNRLFAVQQPYPLARDDDTKAQAGRSSTAEHTAFVKAEVEKILKETGAKQVVLFGLSRASSPIRSYVHSGGGEKNVSHVILSGGINHGIFAIPGYNEGSEFSGTGPFLAGLNAPKNAAGDEVTGPVKWLTIRSDKNDKYAQPDGLWVGLRGKPTNITYAAPELKGATNVVIPRIDHRETALSPAAFEAAHRFITGSAPATTSVTPDERIVLGGQVTGLGLTPTDPASGSFASNLPLAGARLEIFSLEGVTGERRGAAVYTKSIEADGRWGPFTAQPETRYEFVVSAPGYATTHIYRSPFPRSSNVINMRPERIPEVDKNAPSIVTMTRPRGYLDPGRDKMALDGQSPPPGAVLGAGVASSTVKPTGLPRTVSGEFNGERVTGRSWPASENQVSILELTY
jgi:triacylglycerol lipase